MTLYFGETFRRNRQERGLTQEQVAEVFCVSPQAVSRRECSAALLCWAVHGNELHRYLHSRIAETCSRLVWCIWRWGYSADAGR